MEYRGRDHNSDSEIGNMNFAWNDQFGCIGEANSYIYGARRSRERLVNGENTKHVVR